MDIVTCYKCDRFTMKNGSCDCGATLPYTLARLKTKRATKRQVRKSANNDYLKLDSGNFDLLEFNFSYADLDECKIIYKKLGQLIDYLEARDDIKERK